jgi:hypothetical protein
MITVTPITKAQFAAEKKKAFSRRNMRTWGGVCPICGKATSGSGVWVYTNEDGSQVLTEAEAAEYKGQLFLEPVGNACYKAHLGPEYRFTGDGDGLTSRFS